MLSSTHRAGFIALLGRPNAGKSTLFNALVGQELAMTSHKPQATREALVGIAHGAHYQAIYVDTPGQLTPQYLLHQAMMQQVHHAMLGADVLLWVADANATTPDRYLLELLATQKRPIFLVINKIDRLPPGALPDRLRQWAKHVAPERIVPLSARYPEQLGKLQAMLCQHLPLHPAYYAPQTLTDRPWHFFVAEQIRQALLTHYDKEVPYSTQVSITRLVRHHAMVHIHATLYVERPSQQAILIGKAGKALTRHGTTARKALERLLGCRVFLAQQVQVRPQWRTDAQSLRSFGLL